MGFASIGLTHQQDRFGLGYIVAFRQRMQLGGRDAGTIEFECIQRLHPRQFRLMQQAADCSALALLYLGREKLVGAEVIGGPNVKVPKCTITPNALTHYVRRYVHDVTGLNFTKRSRAPA